MADRDAVDELLELLARTECMMSRIRSDCAECTADHGVHTGITRLVNEMRSECGRVSSSRGALDALFTKFRSMADGLWWVEDAKRVFMGKCGEGNVAQAAATESIATFSAANAEYWASELKARIGSCIQLRRTAILNRCRLEQELHTFVDTLFLDVMHEKNTHPNDPVAVNPNSGAVRCQRLADLKDGIQVLLRVVAECHSGDFLYNHLTAAVKQLVAVFLRQYDLSDLIWLCCQFALSPASCLPWGPRCVSIALESAAMDPAKAGARMCSLLLAIMTSVADALAPEEERHADEDESWSFVCMTDILTDGGAVGRFKADTFWPYMEALRIDKMYEILLYACRSMGSASVSPWPAARDFTISLLHIFGDILPKVAAKHSLQMCLQVAVMLRCAIVELNDIRQSIQDDVPEQCLKEFAFVCLCGYRFIASSRMFSLWQVMHTMPLPSERPLDEWRLLLLLFRFGDLLIADMIKYSLDDLKSSVKSTLFMQSVLTAKDDIHFLSALSALYPKLSDRDARRTLLSCLLWKCFSVDNHMVSSSANSSLKSLVRNYPNAINDIILAADEYREIECKELFDTFISFSKQHVVVNCDVSRVMKRWLQCEPDSGAFKAARQLVMYLGSVSYDEKKHEHSAICEMLRFAMKRCDQLMNANESMLRTLTTKLSLAPSDTASDLKTFWWVLVSMVPTEVIRDRVSMPEADGQRENSTAVLDSMLRLRGTDEPIKDVELYISNAVLEQLHSGRVVAVETLREWLSLMDPLEDTALTDSWWRFCVTVEDTLVSSLQDKRSSCEAVVDLILHSLCPSGSKLWLQPLGSLLIISRILRCVVKRRVDLLFLQRWFNEKPPEETAEGQWSVVGVLKVVWNMLQLSDSEKRKLLPWLSHTWEVLDGRCGSGASEASREPPKRSETKSDGSAPLNCVVCIEDQLPLPMLGPSDAVSVSSMGNDDLMERLCDLIVQLATYSSREMDTLQRCQVELQILVESITTPNLWSNTTQEVRSALQDTKVQKEHEKCWETLKRHCEVYSDVDSDQMVRCEHLIQLITSECVSRCDRYEFRLKSSTPIRTLFELLAKHSSDEKQWAVFLRARQNVLVIIKKMLTVHHPDLIMQLFLDTLTKHPGEKWLLEELPLQCMSVSDFLTLYMEVGERVSNEPDSDGRCLKVLGNYVSSVPLDGETATTLLDMMVEYFDKCCNSGEAKKYVMQLFGSHWNTVVACNGFQYLSVAVTQTTAGNSPSAIKLLANLVYDIRRKAVAFVMTRETAIHCLDVLNSINKFEATYPVYCSLYALLLEQSLSLLEAKSSYCYTNLNNHFIDVTAFFGSFPWLDSDNPELRTRCAQECFDCVSSLCNWSIELLSANENDLLWCFILYGLETLLKMHTESEAAVTREHFVMSIKWNAFLPLKENVQQISSMFHGASACQRNLIVSIVVQFRWTQFVLHSCHEMLSTCNALELLFLCSADRTYYKDCVGTLTTILRLFSAVSKQTVRWKTLNKLLLIFVHDFDPSVLFIKTQEPLTVAYSLLRYFASIDGVSDDDDEGDCLTRQRVALSAILRVLCNYILHCEKRNEDYDEVAKIWKSILSDISQLTNGKSDGSSVSKAFRMNTFSELLVNFVLSSDFLGGTETLNSVFTEWLECGEQSPFWISLLYGMLCRNVDDKRLFQLMEHIVKAFADSMAMSWNNLFPAFDAASYRLTHFDRLCEQHGSYRLLYAYFLWRKCKLQDVPELMACRCLQLFSEILEKFPDDEILCVLYLLMCLEELQEQKIGPVVDRRDLMNWEKFVSVLGIVEKNGAGKGFMQWFSKSCFSNRFLLLCRLLQCVVRRYLQWRFPSHFDKWDSSINATPFEVLKNSTNEHFTRAIELVEQWMAKDNYNYEEILLLTSNVLLLIYDNQCIKDRCVYSPFGVETICAD